MKKIVFILLISLLTACDQSPDIMHGFKWGQSMDEIRKSDLKGLDCTPAPQGRACHSFSSPAEQSQKYAYFFVVMQDQGLASLMILNPKKYSNKDALFAEYNRLNNELNTVFGTATSDINNVIQDDSFFTCLSRKSCGEIYSEYNRDGVTAHISPDSDGRSGSVSLLMATQKK
ncbi:hypothetical protein L9H26_00100 [Morganella psychrotolerans]|uniref:Lipoprotein n=2 Tax=Morganella psychrotolerans TaxID=368603 RepID=A0A5M9R181_9GAMM|nr:hypothetical protein [Morganella psychrotolerans]KAA8713586.1 hypothetical protein F4V73_16755 [Morganella psychrotolerans]OBU02875.1 hypothetical protein AYY16_16105 [Morganella psychrotolerans]